MWDGNLLCKLFSWSLEERTDVHSFSASVFFCFFPATVGEQFELQMTAKCSRYHWVELG